MSFKIFEISLAKAKPVRLYQFSAGTNYWRYTSANKDLVFDQQTFKSINISDDGIRQTGEATADLLKINAPASIEVAQMYRNASPSNSPRLVIRDAHAGTPHSLVVWVGLISDVNWTSDYEVEISCCTSGSRSRMGLNLAWQRTCPHVLYDNNCRVQKHSYRQQISISRLDGATLYSDALNKQVNGYWSGGFIEWNAGNGVIERRGINVHQQDAIELIGGTAGLKVKQALIIYPGCDYTITTCHKRFNNSANCAAVPYLPGKSPFDGEPIGW